jgi:hypothetical protein
MTSWSFPNFFPFEPLVFNVSPMGPFAHAEVAYVFDQQDAINEINDAERRARMDLQWKVLFDSAGGVTREAVERVLKGTGPAAEGIKVPEGKKIDDMFYTPQPNILKAPQLFDVARQRQVIDGILGVTPSLTGQSEFKTNTTNKAIEQYSVPLPVADWTSKWTRSRSLSAASTTTLAFLCARFMTADGSGRDWSVRHRSGGNVRRSETDPKRASTNVHHAGRGW